MSILAAVREGKPRGIRKTSGSAVYDLGDQSEALQGTWTELLYQQQRSEIAQPGFVCDSQDRAQTLEVYIRRTDIVMRGHGQNAVVPQNRVGILLCDREHRRLGRFGVAIDKVHDCALVLADNCRVRSGCEIVNCRRMPVVTPRHSSLVVHALLNDCPFAGDTEYEGVQVQLKTVGYSIVVNARGQSAGSDQGGAIEAVVVGHEFQFI